MDEENVQRGTNVGYKSNKNYTGKVINIGHKLNKTHVTTVRRSLTKMNGCKQTLMRMSTDKVILKSLVSQEIIDNVYMNIAKLLSGHTTNIDAEDFHVIVVKSLVYCENENNANMMHCNQFSQNTKPPNNKYQNSSQSTVWITSKDSLLL